MNKENEENYLIGHKHLLFFTSYLIIWYYNIDPQYSQKIAL